MAFCAFSAFSQSYAPPASQVGTTAIHKDSSVFVGWATGVEVKRGYLNAADTNFAVNGNNKASFGLPAEALHKAEGNSMNVVSLGDGGMATLTFEKPIMNGAGPDFAVFENGFTEDFLELAFVEVSSDGIHFFRFPSHSENQFATQIGSYGTMNCRYIHNLAGSYIQGYGTPFDLSDLPVDALLDDNAITHVRIVDVVGSVNPLFGSKDSHGNMVNDPYPTAFASGGFDLDGVGVIYQGTLSVNVNEIQANVYPNPTNGMLTVKLNGQYNIRMLDITGKVVMTADNVQETIIDMESFQKGVFFLEIANGKELTVKKVILN